MRRADAMPVRLPAAELLRIAHAIFAFDMSGLLIFSSVLAALRAGFTMESSIPDSEGFLHAFIMSAAGKSLALVRP